MMKIKNKKISKKVQSRAIFIKLAFVLALILMQINVSFAISPSGATGITPISNQTAPSDPPSSVSAIAGNVTELNIFGTSTTQSWQGYYGNVTGSIELTDGNNRSMYNWSDASPKGEVYATNYSSVIWTNIQCFNFTANGTYCASDSQLRGNTSRCGMNLTQLENSYNISSSDVDGVNETFNRQDHAAFYTNNLLFNSGQCRNTKIFDNSGQGSFDEVLLYSPDTKAVIYTSLLKDNSMGYDGKTHDFEMLVLDDGHATDTAVTNYYFYIELQ